MHHPYVSGLHLRGGPVARGGIRWSDRRTDFRAEVLGLMDTQNLKNVVIVPRGAKGAFIARRPIPAGEDPRPYGKEAYTYFINGLLEVTDNLVDGEIKTPEYVYVTTASTIIWSSQRIRAPRRLILPIVLPRAGFRRCIRIGWQ